MLVTFVLNRQIEIFMIIYDFLTNFITFDFKTCGRPVTIFLDDYKKKAVCPLR